MRWGIKGEGTIASGGSASVAAAERVSQASKK